MPYDRRTLILLMLATALAFGGLYAASLTFGLDPVMQHAGSFLDRLGLTPR